MNRRLRFFFLLYWAIFILLARVEEGESKMPISNEGQDSVELNGVGSTAINVPAGAANGDDIYIQVTNERASDSTYVPSTVSGMSVVNTVGKTTLYCTRLVASPPADYTVNFGAVTDVHGWIKITAVRGAKLYGTKGYKSAVGYIVTSTTSHTLADFATALNGTMQLSFFGARGTAITVPATETELWSSEHTGAHPISVASGYYIVPTPQVVTGQAVTLASANALDVILLTLDADDATTPYLTEWTAIDGFEQGVWPRGFLFDSAASKTYGIGEVSGVLTIDKIDRIAKTVDLSQGYSGKSLEYVGVADQDSTHIYTGHNAPNVLKIAKSDLALIATGDNVPSASATRGVTRVRIGKGWNTGKVWALQFATSAGVGNRNRLVSWSTSTMLIVDNVTLPDDTTPGAEIHDAVDFIVDDDGDMWVLMCKFESGTFIDPFAIVKVGSGLTADSPIELAMPPYQNSDNGMVSMVYDSSDESVFIQSGSQDYGAPEYSTIVKVSLPDGGIDWSYNFAGLYIAQSWAIGSNGLRSVLGTPSLFAGWHDPLHESAPNMGTLVHHRLSDGVVQNAFELPDGYYAPRNASVSPEGEVWLSTWTATEESILIFGVEAALGGGPGSPATDPHSMGRGLSVGVNWGSG